MIFIKVFYIFILFFFINFILVKNLSDFNYIIEIPSNQSIEPYKPLNNYKIFNKNKNSPDPLHNFFFFEEKEELSFFHLLPVNIQKFNNYILYDFGVECPGWLEFISNDLNHNIYMAISEYKYPEFVNIGPKNNNKTALSKKYNNIFRLELNEQLYEGVRFGWIFDNYFNFTIEKIYLVCQAKQVNYINNYQNINKNLEKIWYTGAYTVRSNLLKNYIGSILIDRGDRISFTGDAYISQKIALHVFNAKKLVYNNLIYNSNNCNNIPSYCLLWILSLYDYIDYTNNQSLYIMFENRISEILFESIKVKDLVFIGGDDRLGCYFINPNCDNCWAYYWTQLLYTITETNNRFNNKYKFLEILVSLIIDEYNLDVHSVSFAILSNYYSSNYYDFLLDKYYKNYKSSLAPFNNYFILLGLGKIIENSSFERRNIALNIALINILDSWGGQINLGGTTFFEIYDPNWNIFILKNNPIPNSCNGYTSLCHPWSSGVTEWLLKYDAFIFPKLNFLNKYGKDGFIYFGLNITQLPDYINFYKILNDPIFENNYIRTNNPIATKQTFLINFTVKNNNKIFFLTIYVQDKWNYNIFQTISILSNDNNLLYLPILINDFNNGKYITWVIKSSFFIKVDFIKNYNAIINTIYFDSW